MTYDLRIYDIRLKITENRQPITDNRQQITNNQVTDYQPQPKTHHRKPTTHNRHPKTFPHHFVNFVNIFPIFEIFKSAPKMTNQQPLVSIISPTYNRAHLIGETLDSVLAQTYHNWECVLVCAMHIENNV